MAVDQVKRFQHLQEQRTQAFHELGIILFWYYPFLSKGWIITSSPQINITKSSFAMLPNMKMGLRISRRESGTSISRYSIFGLIFCNFQWSDWEIPEDLFGDNRNQEGSAGTRTTSDTSCLDDRESAGDLHISVWKAGKTQTLLI